MSWWDDLKQKYKKKREENDAKWAERQQEHASKIDDDFLDSSRDATTMVLAKGINKVFPKQNSSKFIRDVYAFPMNKNAQDPLCNAPNTVDEKLLRDVHIKLIEE